MTTSKNSFELLWRGNSEKCGNLTVFCSTLLRLIPQNQQHIPPPTHPRPWTVVIPSVCLHSWTVVAETPTIADKHGQTPLHIAARQGDTYSATVLLEGDALIDAIEKVKELGIG